MTSVGGVTPTYYSLVGGFAGDVNGSIADSYSVGSVTIAGASNLVTAGGFVGATAGTIHNAYSTGVVAAPVGSLAGGFDGYISGGSLTDAYWDTLTSGETAGTGFYAGGTDGTSGLTTTQLQSGLPGGFSSATWSTVAGEAYPYLNWEFPSGAPQVVTGFAYQKDGVTGYAGATVATYYAGQRLTSAQTGGTVGAGANGYYYYLLALGTLAQSTNNNVGALLYAPDGSSIIGLGYNGGGSLADGSMTGLDVADQDPLLKTSATTYSQLTSNLSSTFGPAVYAEAETAIGQSGDLTQIQATGAFTIDQSLTSTGVVQIDAGGALTLNAGDSVTAGGGVTFESGGAMTLSGTVNDAGSVLTLVSGGAISASGATLEAATLTGSANGAATLSGANHVAALSTFTDTTSAFSLNDLSPLAITGLVNVGSNTLTLTDTGTIAETGAGAVDAGALKGSSVGGANFGSTSNNIASALGTFTNTGGGAFSFYTTQPLTVSGNTHPGGNLSLGSAAALTLTGTINDSGSTLNLTAGGALNAPGAVLEATTLTGSANGAATLTGANKISTLGTFTDTTGGVSIHDVSALTIAGVVNAGAGTLTLTDTSAIAESGSGAIDAGTLTGSSVGGANFSSTSNAFTALGTFTNTGGGAVSFYTIDPLTLSSGYSYTGGNLSIGSGGALTLGGTVNNTGNVLSLTSGGALNASTATLEAATLTGSSVGGATLTGANKFGTLGAFTDASGAVSLNDTVALSITGVLSANSLGLTDTGTIAESGSGAIDTGGFAASAAGAVTLNGANQIGSISSLTDMTGNVGITDDSSLAITGVINVGTKTLTLTDTGTVSEGFGPGIVAGTFTGSSVGGAFLNGLNQITTLAGYTDTSGALSLNDTSALNITGAVNAGGVNLTGSSTISESGVGAIDTNVLSGSAVGAVTLNGANKFAALNGHTDTTGAVSLTDDSALNIVAGVYANGQTLTLIDTSTITETGGPIVAATLTGKSSGGATLNGANQIGALGAWTDTTGAISFNDTSALAITGIVNAGTNGVVLTDSGTISESGAGVIDAGSLAGSAGGAVTLLGANKFAILGAFTDVTSVAITDKTALSITGLVDTGSLALVDSSTIAESGGSIETGSFSGSSSGGATLTGANQIAAVTSYTDTDGAISLNNSGPLAITGVINNGTKSLTLTDSGAITEGSAGAIDTGTFAGSSVGGATLTGANKFGTLGAFTDASGAVSLNDTVALDHWRAQRQQPRSDRHRHDRRKRVGRHRHRRICCVGRRRCDAERREPDRLHQQPHRHDGQRRHHRRQLARHHRCDQRRDQDPDADRHRDGLRRASAPASTPGPSPARPWAAPM